MGSGNRHAGFKPHEFRQHFGSPHHRKAPLARCHQFRIITTDSGRDYNNLGIAQIFSRMADMNDNTFLTQTLHIRAIGSVRALHAITEIM